MSSFIKTIIKNKELILEGIKNSIVTKEHVEEIANERKAICDGCPLKSVTSLNADVCDRGKQGKAIKTFMYEDERRTEGTIYNGCGCSLHLKHRSLNVMCPLGKWDALTNDAEVAKTLKEL